MITLFIISLIAFESYMVFNAFKYGITESISSTYYLNKKIGKVLFWAWAVLTAIPLMIFWLNITDGQSSQFLVFLSTSALVFVGTSGAFKEKMTEKVHYISAIIAFALSHLWIAIYMPKFLLFCMLTFAVLISIGRNNSKTEWYANTMECKYINSWLYFAEIACFINIYASLLAWKLFIAS